MVKERELKHQHQISMEDQELETHLNKTHPNTIYKNINLLTSNIPKTLSTFAHVV